MALSSFTTVPVVNVAGFLWGKDLFVIPEYSFGVQVHNSELQLSKEHLQYQWLAYEEAYRLLKWDSNKNALWELNYKIHMGQI